MRILSCIFVIIGIIIGAGFASGKEIYTFFFAYGLKGILGITISVSLIGFIIYKSLKIIISNEINSYDEFLKKIIKKTVWKNINIEIILNFIINLFLLITFFVMCAGFSAYFQQEFGINQIYSSIIIAILSYTILSNSIKGIFTVNSILIPLIIIILSILGIKGINTNILTLNEIKSPVWFFKAILYASYNCITLISMLIPIKKYIKSKSDILKISIITVIVIIILAMIIMILLSNIPTDISKIELPAVYASRVIGEFI